MLSDHQNLARTLFGSPLFATLLITSLTTSESYAQPTLQEIEDFVVQGSTLSADPSSLVDSTDAADFAIGRLQNFADDSRLRSLQILSELSSWSTSSGLDEARGILYSLVDDQELGEYADNALMSSEGMLFEIANTEVEGIVQGYELKDSLTSIFEAYPDSRYAATADYFVGLISTEMYFIDENHDSTHLENAVSEFNNFRERLQSGSYNSSSSLSNDAEIRSAVTLFLLGDSTSALSALNVIRSEVPEIDTTVDQIFIDRWMPPDSQLINEYYNSHQLSDYIIDYILYNEPPSILDFQTGNPYEPLGDFLDYLTRFENRDYRVVFGSHRSRVSAESALSEYSALLSMGGISNDGVLMLLEPRQGSTWFGVGTAANLSESDAVEFRRSALDLGLPRDAFLWRPQIAN